MTQTKATSDHLSDFERAICYYTLPQVTSPMTFGLIVAYAVCLLEAIAATAFGLLRGDPTWTKWGTICFAGIVIFGVVAFLVRAFLNDFRQRRALASAQGVPDATAEALDVPDPFADHVLLRYPRHHTERTIDITDNSGNLRYTVEGTQRGRRWAVSGADGQEAMEIEAKAWARSFAFERGAPSRLVVRRGGEEVARIRRRAGLMAPVVDIVCGPEESDVFVARARSLYKGDRVIGRIYYIRRHIYLDVEEDCFHDGILSFFIAMA